MSDRFWKKFVENPDATYEEIPSNFHLVLGLHKDHSDPEWPNELAKLVCPICEALREKQRACRKTARITPRPQHGDVVIERDDWPTVLVVVRHRTGASDPAGEALALARRFARIDDLERVESAAWLYRAAWRDRRGEDNAQIRLFVTLDDAAESNDEA